MTKDEVELKFLRIDKESICQKIESIGAKKIYSHELRSVGFDAPGYTLTGEAGKSILRVRKNGSVVELTHKGPNRSTDYKNRPETEITSNCSFEQAVSFLEKLGYTPGWETRKHRTHYELEDTHFEIDEYARVPAYLEIETPSEQRMREVCEHLGLSVEDGRTETITALYPSAFTR